MEISNDEVDRYSRQMILPQIGMDGQKALKSAKILICGAGGLGCPAAQYLAAAGIGTIGIVDYDTVEVSNLHRQVAHRTETLGTPKTESLKSFVTALNPNVKVETFNVIFNSKNALEIIKQFDVVLDASDNVATRYLVNDCCVLAGKPLVSGSALRFEGQLMVYGYNKSACYRCVYPKPPPAHTVTNCSDGGVLGVVPGIIGSIQALEAMKAILPGMEPTYVNAMLLFDALSCSFRKIKMRTRSKNCPVCGDSPTIKEPIDYLEFCGVKAPDDKDKPLELLSASERITVPELQERFRTAPNEVILLDVREPVELTILSPFKTVKNHTLRNLQNPSKFDEINLDLIQTIEKQNVKEIICLCRRGNASQKAVLALRKNQNLMAKLNNDTSKIMDLTGGYTAWVHQVEPHLPLY